MTTAISMAAKDGAKAVICASTGNTSASAAAYATKAGMTCAVLVPDGKIAMGKLSQAIAHGATLLQVDGNFDDCLTLARKLAEAYPSSWSTRSTRPASRGRRPAAFEVVDALGDAPDIHCLPVGNAGNITAYWKGYREYHRGSEQPGPATTLPQMWGFQAAGAAPIVLGHPVDEPETIATAIRIGNPASWKQAEAARDESGGRIDSVTDEQILAAHRCCPPGGRLRRARLGGVGRRSAAGRTRPARSPPARPSSAPSPGTGSRTRSGRCATPTGPRSRRPGAGRRVHGRAGARPPGLMGEPVAGSSVHAGPGQQREPRPGLRLGRARARAVGRRASRRVTDEPGVRVDVAGGGRRRGAARRQPPGRPRHAARLRPSWA